MSPYQKRHQPLTPDTGSAWGVYAGMSWAGRLAHQRDGLLLLGLAERGRLARSTPPTPRRQSCPAARPVALDPAVHRVGVDPEHPRGLGLGHAAQHRSDGLGSNAACAAAGSDRVS
jgi:hypothetical protein